MNLTLRGSVALAGEILAGTKGLVDREIAVFPPFTSLSKVAEALVGGTVKVGAQDLYFEAQGAFTGEVSGAQAHDAGARLALAGHSERRHVIGETDDIVNKKVRAALKAGLQPVLCVGERLSEREAGQTTAVVTRQVREGLRDVTDAELARIVIAYEPVWAIGTGKVATPDQAQEVHALIRKLLKDSFRAQIASEMRILYGGSVKPDNVDGLMAMPDIDGTLVGGASLEAPSFIRIARFHEA
jgi:triosephosphate isomerase